MLSALRKKKVAKRILWVLAIIIIPAFVLWGTGNIGKKTIGGSSFVGIINGKKVSIEDFYNAKRGSEVQIFLGYFAQREALDKMLKDRSLMNSLTWDRLIILDAAKRQGIKVTDAEIISFITRHPLFTNNGVFDQKFYDYMLTRTLGISARTFEEEVRDSLMIEKLRDSVLRDASVTDDEVMAAYKKEFEKGRISYVRAEKDSFKEGAEITPDEISAYYNAFKDRFKTPEEINLQYFEFQYANYAEKEGILNMLEMSLGKLKKNEQTFLASTGQFGKEAEETGFFSQKALPPKLNLAGPLSNEIFGFSVGSVKVISDESQDGMIHLLRVKEKKPSGLKTRDEAAPEIVNILIDEKAQKKAEAAANGVSDAIKKDKLTLEEAASRFNLKVDTTELISRFTYVGGIGDAYEMLDGLFNLEYGAVEGPFKTRKGYVIARLDEFQEIDVEKFAAEKEEYRNKVLAVKKNEAIKKWYEGISKNSRLAVDLNLL